MNTPRGRIAGVDFGTVRIGVAISDPDHILCSPLTSHTRGGPDADARFFRRLAEEEDVTAWVVGLPVHLSGHESEKSLQAREFGQWLAEVTGLEVAFFDERFSTAMADTMMEGAGLTKKRRKARRDMLAAQVILSAYLESEGRDTTQGLE